MWFGWPCERVNWVSKSVHLCTVHAQILILYWESDQTLVHNSTFHPDCMPKIDISGRFRVGAKINSVTKWVTLTCMSQKLWKWLSSIGEYIMWFTYKCCTCMIVNYLQLDFYSQNLGLWCLVYGIFIEYIYKPIITEYIM